MIWAGISINGRSTDLHIIRNVNLGPKVCRRDTETSCRTPYAAARWFLSFNAWYARHHTACLVKDMLESWNSTEYGIDNMLSWPKSNQACLGHTWTTHGSETKASFYCLELEDCASWGVLQYSPKSYRYPHRIHGKKVYSSLRCSRGPHCHIKHLASLLNNTFFVISM